MYVLRVELAAPDCAAWKRAFDGDPLGRGAVGVRCYRVMRPVEDPARIMIDLDFGDLERAEAVLARLRELWARVTAAAGPEAEITEVVETGRH